MWCRSLTHQELRTVQLITESKWELIVIRVSVRFESVISIESRHLKLLNHKFVIISNLDDNYM